MNLSSNRSGCNNSRIFSKPKLSIAEKCIAGAARDLFRVARQVIDEQQPLGFCGRRVRNAREGLQRINPGHV